MKKLTLMTTFALTFFSLETKADKAYQLTIKCPHLDTPIGFENNSSCPTSGGYCYTSVPGEVRLQAKKDQTYATPGGQLGLTWTNNTLYSGLKQEPKKPKGTFEGNSILPSTGSSTTLSLVCTYNVSGLATSDMPFNLYAFVENHSCGKAENGIFHCKM